MGTDEHACPECGQPVATAVHRYKTLGVWAPRWGPGPCHNPDCAAYTYEPGQGHGPGQGHESGQGHGQGRRDGPGLPEEAAAEKT